MNARCIGGGKGYTNFKGYTEFKGKKVEFIFSLDDKGNLDEIDLLNHDDNEELFNKIEKEVFIARQSGDLELGEPTEGEEKCIKH